MDYAEEAFKPVETAICSACGSPHCSLQSTARKTGTVVGGVLGTIIAAGFNGASIGAVNGVAIACVVSRRLPATVTGAITGSLVGFAWGAFAGHAIGTEIDKNVLRLYRCRECGFEFKA